MVGSSSKGMTPVPARREPRGASRVVSVRAEDARGRSFVVLERVERGAGGDEDVVALVQRSRAGDELAFAELYVLFFDRVYRYLVVALKNPDDAQEVAQDVFVRALSMLDRYEPDRGRFRDWLFSMVRNLAIDHLRKGRATSVQPDAVPHRAETIEERATSLLEYLDPEGGVRDLIDALPDSQRRVVALRFVFQLSTTEIAEVLGLTSAGVRQLQHRALKALAGGISRPPI
ncbi:MAG: sigma-70 family RNA polymerase sigma factor [Actinomycetota bacterium]|nr:sigma-70 family RNA polymerase sigma factor [Actinomycetota bacterium]